MTKLSTKRSLNLLYLLYSTAQRHCLLHLIKQNCLLKTFLKTLTLITQISSYMFSLLEYETAMALRHWIPNPGVPCLKPLGGSKVDSAFHPSKVDKMSTRNFWELNGKKLAASSKWL